MKENKFLVDTSHMTHIIDGLLQLLQLLMIKEREGWKL